MINKLWLFLIASGIIYGIFAGNISIINEKILASATSALDMMLELFPVIALWLGIMKIAEKAGLIKQLSNLISPLLSKLFPDIPKGHESLGLIASNIIINMLGLGSAATPVGLKAIKSLQELNQKKDTASRSMITFLVINTSGVTIIPTTIISMRIMHNSTNPTEIVAACIMATFISTIAGIIIDRILARRYNA